MTAPAAPPAPSGRIRLLIFAGFFLLLGAWAVATPYNGAPDEREHALRAAGVARGQVALAPEAALAGGGAFVVVPKSLDRYRCWQFFPDQPASCMPEPVGDESLVRVPTGAGRYPPVYYAAVGGPLAVWPDWTGILLARLLSAAWCAALLSMALLDAMRWSRHRFMALGVLVTATPMVAHMGGSINPSGPEMAAGVAFFAAAVPLLFQPAARRSTPLLTHLGIAALCLALLRVAGPLWLAVAAVALLVPLRWAALRDLWAWRAVRWWTLGVAGAVLASGTWTIVFRATELGDLTEGARYSLVQAALIELGRWPGYLDQVVGVMSWLDTHLPAPVYLLWQGVAAAVIVAGLVLATRADRWRIAALAVAGVVIPSALTISYANESGFITQGRYLFPVLAGLPVFTAYVIAQAGVSAARSRWTLRAVVLALFPLHLVALAYTMVRWQHGLVAEPGLRALNPLAGPWHPPLGSVVPLVACVVAIVLIGWQVWVRSGDDHPVGTDGATAAPEATGAEPPVGTAMAAAGDADRSVSASGPWSAA